MAGVDDPGYDDYEQEDLPPAIFVPVRIEYHSEDRNKIVEVYGSWDDFVEGIRLNHISQGLYVVDIELPVGSHYYRFWLPLNEKKNSPGEYDTNLDDPKSVYSGIEYNTVEVSDEQEDDVEAEADAAEDAEDEGGENDTHLIFDGGNLVVGASTKKKTRRKRKGRPSMEVVLDTTFVEDAQQQDQMDALEEAKEDAAGRAERKRKKKHRSKKKKKKGIKPSGFEFQKDADLAQVFKQKEEEWARMCFVQQLRQQQQHNDEINRVKTLWKQERAVRVDMHKKVMQQKNEMEKKLIGVQAEVERLKSSARIGETADRRKVEQVQREKEHLQTEVNNLRSDNRNLQAQMQDIRREKLESEKSTRAQTSDLDVQQKRMQAELSQLKADSATLRAQNENLTRNLATIKETNDQLLASKQEQFNQREQRWEEEKAGLLRSREQARELQQKTSELENELRGLKSEKDNVEARAEQAAAKITQLEERLQNSRQQVNDLENSTAAQDQIRVEVERTRATLEIEKQTLADKIGALERRLAEQRDSYEEQIAQLRKKHTSDMTSMTEQTDAEMSRQLAELQQQIAEKDSSIRESADRIQTLEGTLGERDGTLATLQTQLDASREECAAEQAKEAELRQAKKIADDEIQNLRQQCEDLQNNAQSAEQQATSKVTSLEAELNALRESSGAQAQELQEENTRLNEQIVGLKQEVDASAANASDASQKLIEAQQEIENARGEGSALQSRLDSLQETLEAERVQSGEKVKELSDEINQVHERTAAELSQKDSQIQAIQDEAADLRQQISDRDNQQMEAQTKIEQMQSELELSKNQWDREREALERQVGAAQQKDEMIINACKGMFQKFQALRNDLDEIRNNKIMELEKMNEFFPNFNSLLDKAFGFNQSMVENLMAKYKKELSLRRKYFNIVQDLRGNIRVFCRVRPFVGREIDQGARMTVDFPDDSAEPMIRLTDHNDLVKDFTFDKVYAPGSTQSDVTQDTTEYVQSVLDGYNVSIFAYGQTGSGKTYTMDGPADDPGVNSAALQHLFKIAAERAPMFEYDVKLACFEIYNGKIQDLLVGLDGPTLVTATATRPAPQTKKTGGRRGASGRGRGRGRERGRGRKKEGRGRGRPTPEPEHKQQDDGTPRIQNRDVINLKWHHVENPVDVNNITSYAKERRAAAATDMNEQSSRSHLFILVDVRGINVVTNIEYLGRLYLVDLAGSENTKRSGVSGTGMTEARKINESLTALGAVMSALQQKANFIPYRDSILTQALEPAIGGNAKTVMFVNCSPSHDSAYETLQSLQFAQGVAKVELGQARQQKQGR